MDESSRMGTRRSKRLRATAPEHSGNTPRKARKIHKAQQSSSVTAESDRKVEEETSSTESIDEDDLCPICQQLSYRPVTTRCNHTSCESCFAHWADVSGMGQTKIVDVDEPVESVAVTGLDAKCPMCRTQTMATFNADMATRLATQYPHTWKERSIEEADSFNEQGSIQTLTVYVGNRHQLVPAEKGNCHDWTFFCRPSRTDIIEEVQFALHPTFRPDRIIRQRPPYEIRRRGWGNFTVTAYVILKAGYTWVPPDAEPSPDGAENGMFPLSWVLDFQGFGGKGSMGGLRLKVKNDRDWNDVSDEEEDDVREWLRVVRSYQRDGRYEPPEEED